MNTTEYAIEQKHNGTWYGLDWGMDSQRIRDELRDLRKEHPDREYQLVKVTKKREIVG